MLLTTQYLEEADVLADNIVVIDHGSVIAEGTATQLKERLGATVIEIAMRDDDGDGRAPPTLLAPVGERVARRQARPRQRPRRRGPRGRCSRRCASSTREHLDPATMVLREPTLDDVFLELTGRTRRATATKETRS